MKKLQVVIDINVLVAALRSRKGASHHLFFLVGDERFDINVSVPLIFEYEDVTKRFLEDFQLTYQDVDDILDYLCSVANHWQIFYLWRPFLKDPKDEMIVELAVAAECDYIVTYNVGDFEGLEQFGVKVITPKSFLEIIGELR